MPKKRVQDLEISLGIHVSWRIIGLPTLPPQLLMGISDMIFSHQSYRKLSLEVRSGNDGSDQRPPESDAPE